MTRVSDEAAVTSSTRDVHHVAGVFDRVITECLVNRYAIAALGEKFVLLSAEKATACGYDDDEEFLLFRRESDGQVIEIWVDVWARVASAPLAAPKPEQH